MTKRIRVFAGPNGSGKTSLYRQLKESLKGEVDFYDFINADDMKATLAEKGFLKIPFDADQQALVNAVDSGSWDDATKRFFSNNSIRCEGKTVIFTPEAVNSYTVAAFADFLRYAYLGRRKNFTMETVFSHESKIDFLRRADELGYCIYLYLVATDDPRLNVKRVGQRVAEGGHDVPEDKIISRYDRCLDNFHEALQYAYRAYFFDNSREMTLIAEQKPGHQLLVNKSGGLPKWFSKYVIDKIIC